MRRKHRVLNGYFFRIMTVELLMDLFPFPAMMLAGEFAEESFLTILFVSGLVFISLVLLLRKICEGSPGEFAYADKTAINHIAIGVQIFVMIASTIIILYGVLKDLRSDASPIGMTILILAFGLLPLWPINKHSGIVSDNEKKWKSEMRDYERNQDKQLAMESAEMRVQEEAERQEFITSKADRRAGILEPYRPKESSGGNRLRKRL